MKEIIDRSRQTFNKLFDTVGKFGSKYDTYNFTAFDTETNALLRGDAKLGAQTDIFKQGASGIRTLFARKASFDKFGNIKDESAVHLLMGGGKISSQGEKFFKDVGLTVDRILPNFEEIPTEYREKLRGKVLTNRSLNYLEAVQKRTGKKLLTGEGELADVLNTMLGHSPNTMNVAIGHNASRFDLMMARGVKGFKGVGSSTHILDTYELTTRMFPELAVEKTGALELDNLISLMMYGSGNKTKARIKDPLRQAAPTEIDAIKFYGLDNVPDEFKAVSRMFGGPTGVLAAGAHSADVDSLRSMALLHAAMLRAETSKPASEIFHKYLTEVGIKEHLSAIDIMSRIKKFDPQQVSRYMNVGGYKGKIKDLYDIIASGQTSIDDVAIYSKAGTKQLFSDLTNRFGKEFTASFAGAAESLMASMDTGVFMLKGNSLKFGKLGDAGSFIALPTQNFNKLGTGLVNVGDKLRSVTNLLSLGKDKVAVVPFARYFYSNMNRVINSGMVPTEQNAAYALPNIVKQTLGTKVFENKSLGSLLGAHPTEMGLPAFASNIAKAGSLQVLDGNAPIIQHFKNLRSAIQQRNISIGNNLAKFRQARQLIESSIAGLSSELNRLGIGPQAAFTKAESFLDDGLKLNVGKLFTNMSIAETRGFEKGRRRNLGDISRSHGARLSKLGRPIGPSVVTEQWMDYGIKSSAQAGIFVAEFDTMQNLRNSFEDSASYATKTGLNLLKRKRYAGSVTIKNWTSKDVDLLNKYLDPSGGFNLIPGSDFRPTEEAGYFKIRNRSMFADKRKEIARELFAGKSNVQRRALKQIVDSRSALTQAVFTEDAIQLKFATRAFTSGRSDSLLFGPLGALRTTVGDYIGDAMSKLFRGIGADFVMSAENFKGMAPADLITNHRISVIQRHGALDELLDFLNSNQKGFRLAESNVPGIRTLVLPSGVTKDEVLKFTDLFKQHVVKTAANAFDKDRTKRTLKILRDYDGIRTSGNVIKKIASLGMKGITSASRLFLTDVHLRADEASDINRLRNVRMNAQQLAQYKQSLMASGIESNSVFRYLDSMMAHKTGFSAARGVVNPGKLGFIGQAFSGKLPSNAHVLKLGANKQLIDQFGGSYGFLPKVGSGHILTESALAGTIYDSKYADRQFFIDLGQAERFTVKGRKERQILTRYLPVPNLRNILGVKVGEGGAHVSSGSLAGKVFRAIRGYTSEGNLDAMHTLKSGGRYTIRDTVSSALDMLLKSIPGKKGLAKGLTTFSIKESVNARLLGKSASGDLAEAFTAELDSRQFAEWAHMKFGSKKATKLLSMAKNDSLYGLMRADPMQKGGHAMIVKYRLVDRGGHPSAKMDVFSDPFLVSRLNRDTDKDAVRLLLFDQITAKDLQTDFNQQVAAHATDFNTYLKNLSHTKAPSINGILTNSIEAATKGVQQSSDTLTAHLGMKMNASLGYTISKAPEALLNKALEAKSPEELIDILTSKGVDRNSISEEVIKALTEQNKDKTAAAIELFQSFKQAGVKKGAVKTAMYDALEEITGLMERIRSGSGNLHEAIDVSSKVFTNFFTKIANEDLIRPSAAAKFLSEDVPTSAGQLVEETYGRAFFAVASLRGKVNDVLSMTRAASPAIEEVIGSTLEAGQDASAIMGVDAVGEAAEPIINKIAPSLRARAGEFISQQKGKAKDFLSSDGGRLALWGAGILGAYSIFKTMTSSPEELAPPPLQMETNSAPLPPPPMLQQPVDVGLPNVPNLNQKIARVTPAHPTRLPRQSKIRQYNNYRVGYGSANINGRIEDNTSTMNRAVIAQRMNQIANSDFTY